MADKSKIEWTDATWNPTRGCNKIAQGCKNCYAERFAERFRGVKGHAYEQGFDPRTAPDQLTLPLTRKKPRRVFVDSMSDLFHEAFPFEYVDMVYAVMALAPQHTFQVLTKRPERAAAYFNSFGDWNEAVSRGEACAEWILGTFGKDGMAMCERVIESRFWKGLPNVLHGTSIAHQPDADKNIPHLLQIPGKRFLSIEPMIGPVDLRLPLGLKCAGPEPHTAGCYGSSPISWVIYGGESGPGARPCNVQWIRDGIAQCRAAGVPVFVKQFGARPYESHAITSADEPCPPQFDGDGAREGRAECRHRLFLRDRKGGDISEWPEDLRVREVPWSLDGHSTHGPEQSRSLDGTQEGR